MAVLRICWSLLCLLLVSVPPALAADGVGEINQTCATSTGCFSGDTPGFPVTITGAAGRSYKLTGDLGVINANTTVIEIAADDTTIDLAGFRIVCSSFVPPSSVVPCSQAGSGTGSGIAVDDNQTRSGVEVRNGSITGMGNSGVILGIRSVVRDLRATACANDGILVVQGRVEGNVASGNGDEGIFAGPGSTVLGNTAYQNGDDGIFAAEGSTVAYNAVFSNAGDGIVGIDGSTIHGNSVRFSGDYGLNLGATAAYRENTITTSASSTGTVIGGVDAGGNVCELSTTCP